MPTANNWNVNADGDWATAANWSLGTVPTSSNIVTISTADLHTITHNSGTDYVYSLKVGANDHFSLNGGSIEIVTTASFANGFTQTGGTLINGKISITGPGTLIGGTSTGTAAFTITGTIALANYTFAGASVITNNATTNQTGNVTVGDVTGVNATIANGSGASYVIAGDYGIAAGATSAKLTNAGTIDKSSGNGTSTIAVNTTSTGTIQADSGNLQFTGATNTISGTLTGAGQISVGGSSVTSLSGTVSVATFGIYNAATLNVNSTIAYAGVFVMSSYGSNTTLSLGTHTFKVTGAQNSIIGSFGSAVITGSGTFSNAGTTSLSNLIVGGTETFANARIVNQIGTVTVGDGSGNAAAITNSGTWNITTDSNIGVNNAIGTFSSTGLLRKMSSTGTSSLSLAVTSAGTISATTGTLNFNNLTNSGTINGSGTVTISGGGSATFNSGTVLSVARFSLLDTSSLTLGASLSYAGVFNDNAYGNDTLNLGAFTLTLSGKSNAITGSFGSAIITGSGTLSNTGQVTVSSMILAGTATFANQSGATVNETGAVTLGDGSGNAPAITNAGTWNITGDTGIGENGVVAPLTNTGLFRKLSGTGSSTINVAVTSSGTIGATSGTLYFNNSLVNTGLINGAGAVGINGTGAATFNAGTSLTVATFDLFDTASLTLGASLSYAGVFNDSAYGNNSLNLGANTLTLSGKSNTLAGSFGSAVVTGSGTIANTGQITASGVVLTNTVTLDNQNKGVIKQTGAVTIGGSTGETAEILNDAGATYTMVAGNIHINNGSATTSHFDNAGTFNVTAGVGGTDFLGTTFNNLTNGTINITSGTLENDGILVNSGTVAGNVLTLTGTSQTTFDTGSNLTLKEIDLFATAYLTFADTFTLKSVVNDLSYGTNVIDVGDNNLYLTGADTFGGIGAAVITGSGRVKLANTTNFSGGTVVAGKTLTLEVASTVTAVGQLQVGDSSGSAARMVIDAPGTYNLVTDSGISHGNSAASNVLNNGLFEKTAGTGTSVVSAAFTNNGNIKVTSGTIEFLAGTLTNNGTITGTVTTDTSGNVFVRA